MLSALVLYCAFAWRRTRPREVEAEIVAPEELWREEVEPPRVEPTVLRPEQRTPPPPLAEVVSTPAEPPISAAPEIEAEELDEPEKAEAEDEPPEPLLSAAPAIEAEEIDEPERARGDDERAPTRPVESLPPEPLLSAAPAIDEEEMDEAEELQLLEAVESEPPEPLLSAAPDVDDEEMEDAEEPKAAEPVDTTLPEPVDEGAAANLPTVSTEEWSCEIALWPEQGEAVFYARSFHDGDEIVVAESPRFPTGVDGTVDRRDAALRAHAELCKDLARGGWRRAGSGPEWYADRFRREFGAAAVSASLTTRIVFARLA